MKKKIKKVVCCALSCCLVFATPVYAKEPAKLSPVEIDTILKDVEPIEIEQGVYLRDNGEVSIIDVDVSQFETKNVGAVYSDKGRIELQSISDISVCSWDLSTPYIASFSAKYRVLSGENFTGCDTLYVQCYDVSCPSNWKVALYNNGWTEIASSPWQGSSKTTYTSKFYNMNKSNTYRGAFVKTDDGKQATGVMKVYVK